jgi:cation transport regulator ChaC
VSPDYLNTVTSKNIPPPPPQSPNTEEAEMKHNSSKRLRSVKKIRTEKKKKYLSQREHDRWVAKRFAAKHGRNYDKLFKVRGKLHELDIERKNQIKAVTDFLKEVLPASPSSDTQTEHGPP